MTADKPVPRRIVALPKDCAIGKLKIFELPNPSNIESKGPIKVFMGNGKVYQLKKKTFSRGCEFNRVRDSSNESYHYTARAEPIKSGILVNNAQREDGWLLSDGSFEFSTEYDLGFSLCGAFFRGILSKDENQYLQPELSETPTPSIEDRFLMTRDFLGSLVDQHSPNWSHVPLECLQSCMSRLCDCVEEAGDVYYKISSTKITQWLASKVKKIIENFPKSVPLPRNVSGEIETHCKAVFACNLLISLVPRQAYNELIRYEDQDLNLAEAFRQYKKFQEDELKLKKEQELLIESAMKAGITSGSAKKPVVQRVTKVVKTNKIKSGKGAIDGFFKKKNTT
ncbi:LAFA_0E12310g1_1 [Lachancea sp. 'fantastica']|nr:LAFA_0E12310g1_1 [Lachancea sp. 'fantastica']